MAFDGRFVHSLSIGVLPPHAPIGNLMEPLVKNLELKSWAPNVTMIQSSLM
jgi:hypothetical protein